MHFMDYANRKTFRDNYMSPLRIEELIELTIPDNVNNHEQKYPAQQTVVQERY